MTLHRYRGQFIAEDGMIWDTWGCLECEFLLDGTPSEALHLYASGEDGPYYIGELR